jgi:hypothetical protein
MKRTLSDWAMVVTVALTIISYALFNEGRLARVEQKLDDLIAYVKITKAQR